MTENAGKILDALYKLLIIDQREEIEEIGGEVLLSKVDGKTLRILIGVKRAYEKNEEQTYSH